MAGYYFLTLAVLVVVGFLPRAASRRLAWRCGARRRRCSTRCRPITGSTSRRSSSSPMLLVFAVGAPLVGRLAIAAALSHLPTRGCQPTSSARAATLRDVLNLAAGQHSGNRRRR